ncbi:Zinc finger, RING/FYVE/PHD-type [Metarhizium album ARSEF 1941]|uniref:Zinc finger, RING/FYVE/PHD-type n=1 Tax=Metarhizium album (strain ARSEF 1941) TaxID=1081103 RepID=A0A0B2WRL9_METAS|nr:Zinc finger, RING/FYVE/PHD-type [Metarhizium album ARSEF 1941]KHN96147.1 Zinc finger, RING/FYVE/PHD-type [Metarhizium album ARSEF 1941]
MSLSNAVAGKTLCTPTSYPPQPQAVSTTSSFESSRRPSQPGPSAHPTPRKGQASRKQHKNQRRPGADQRNHSNPDEYDAMAELRAVRNPSSRRGQTSITHLLNYTSPRHLQDHSYHPRSYRRNPNWGPGSGHHATDKSRYVHSNYRFVVSPEGIYTKHEVDADVFLDWEDVLQVIASSESQTASCPICLSDPVAPRMAKCGHIFCLPCIIRFMHSNIDDAKSAKGSRWKKCPICEDIMYLHEVKPVRFYAGQESPLPRVGDDVVLRLMARKADSTLALPREGGAEVLNSGEDVPWHFAANVLDYSRIMKGTAEYMATQYHEEIAALLKQEKEDETLFGSDPEWTRKARDAVETAKKRTDALKSPDGSVLLSRLGSPVAKPSSHADFYFYGAPPHLYLSPLDIRILKAKYGSFAAFPSTLLPRVEHISTGHVVDEVLRKRTKYLAHLPQGCIISFLECDWTDIVSAEILESFAGDIEKRRKRNREKAAREERERLQSERLEAAALRGALGVTARRHTALESVEEDHSPALDMSEFQPLTGQSGMTPPDPRPGFETLASMSTSPSTQRTVWGTRVVPASPNLAPTTPAVDDGWLRDEEFLGTTDLAMQIEAIEAMEGVKGGDASTAATVGEGGAGAGAGKKKKKKQKITLMSTGGRRGQ